MILIMEVHAGRRELDLDRIMSNPLGQMLL